MQISSNKVNFINVSPLYQNDEELLIKNIKKDSEQKHAKISNSLLRKKRKMERKGLRNIKI